MSEPDEDHAAHRSRYEAGRDECIARIEKMQDEFSRGFAIHQIIEMCVTAGDTAVARALLVSVQDDFLRNQILESAPTLKAQVPRGRPKIDVKERRFMQDLADALVNDWLFQPDRRDDVIRTLARTQPPIRAALLVAMMGRRLSQEDLTELAAAVATATAL